jgi:aldehyde dehydrogenase (NAD+)
MIIGGKAVQAHSGKTLEVRSPVDGLVFATIPRGEAADIDAAVSAARQALEGAWGQFSALERGRLMLKMAQKVDRKSVV